MLPSIQNLGNIIWLLKERKGAKFDSEWASGKGSVSRPSKWKYHILKDREKYKLKENETRKN